MAYKYSATCHTKCYWLENLWEVGEVYEGNEKPNKHFNQSGEAPEVPPPTRMDDSRSNKELRDTLKKLNFTAPEKSTRKELWSKLRDLEIAISKDELTNPSEKFFAKCGFQAKTQAGVGAHERRCKICSEEPEVLEAA
jgi:hypothetical protein